MEDAKGKLAYWISMRMPRKRRPEGWTLQSIIRKEMEKQSGQPSVPNKYRYFIYASRPEKRKCLGGWAIGPSDDLVGPGQLA